MRRRWALEPFSGDIVDGKFFGRGSIDMKGGIPTIMPEPGMPAWPSIQVKSAGLPVDKLS